MPPAPPNPLPLAFTSDELDTLGHTADALSAYLGKPVLAEVIDAVETGFEWVIFAIPLENGEDTSEITTVQVGGPGSRLIGSRGGLSLEDGEIYACRYLWAIQLSDIEGVRFIKIDDEGEEVAWSDELANILPFALTDVPPAADDDDDDDPDDEADRLFSDPPHTLH